MLHGLSQLTSLNLGYGCFEKGATAPCPPWSTLQQLRELRLGVNNLEMLQGLPLGLTLLELESIGKGLLSNSTAPSIAQLTALQHFKVEAGNGQVCPSILLHMQHLQHLDLSHIAGQGVPVLLAALHKMQQLQHLNLNSQSCQPLEEDAMQQYAALTASTHLAQLDMCYDEHILATGAARYMFAAGKQLPHLTRLWCTLGLKTGTAPTSRSHLAQVI